VKIVLFGATGNAGGSILRTCLAWPLVDEVRVIVRRPLAFTDPKLRVFVHADFLDLASVSAAFDGVDVCFYALGKSVTQVSGEAEYRTITHDYAVAAAQQLHASSPRAPFYFISGAGTRADSRMMWARVKAETERELQQTLDTVCWRPSFIDGEISGPRIYRVLRPLFRLLRPLRSIYVSGEDIGRAMLQAATHDLRGGVIENREIRSRADALSGA
jgi:uncharacterized protein YbjT (DUF2867 family)